MTIFCAVHKLMVESKCQMDMKMCILGFENNNKLIPWSYNDLELSKGMYASSCSTQSQRNKRRKNKKSIELVWTNFTVLQAIYAMIILARLNCAIGLNVICLLVGWVAVSSFLSVIPIHSDILSCGWHFFSASQSTLHLTLSFDRFASYIRMYRYYSVSVRLLQESITTKNFQECSLFCCSHLHLVVWLGCKL